MGNFFSFNNKDNGDDKDNDGNGIGHRNVIINDINIPPCEFFIITFHENEDIIINVKDHEFYAKYCKSKIIDLNILEKHFVSRSIDNVLLEPCFNLTFENLQITKIENFPFYIKSLNCSNNMITHLDDLPENISILNCSHNNISQLNDLPISMEELDCSYNKLIKLDNLPHNLIRLNCSHNGLANLNNLPIKLIYLNCSNNYFNELSNYNFQSLTCDYAIKNINEIKIHYKNIISVEKGIIKVWKN